MQEDPSARADVLGGIGIAPLSTLRPAPKPLRRDHRLVRRAGHHRPPRHLAHVPGRRWQQLGGDPCFPAYRSQDHVQENVGRAVAAFTRTCPTSPAVLALDEGRRIQHG
ncbi:hypothetical protein JT27_18270 [Alcaligenes faecalis]|nr:hypothetical protein JT27_18270 [Alcaligenes faecalis]